MLKKNNSTRRAHPLLLMGLMAFLSFFMTSCGDDDGDGNKAILIPVILSFSPESGEPGDQVTITGTDLGNASEVKFGTTAAIISSNTGTSIVATVPEDGTTGKITVVTPGGTAISTGTFEVIVVGAPAITSVSLISAERGETISIIGTEMTTVSSVQIGGKPATVMSTTETTVEVEIASDAAYGETTIAVTNDGGTTTTSTEALPFYVVDVHQKFGDSFDRDTVVYSSGGYNTQMTAWGRTDNIKGADGAAATPTMLPTAIDGKFYYTEGIVGDQGGSYTGQVGFSKQAAGSMNDFFAPGTTYEDYYYNIQMNFNTPADYDEVLVGLRIRFEDGSSSGAPSADLEYRPTAADLAALGFTPDEAGWYNLSIPFSAFITGNPGTATWADYGVSDITRYIVALRREGTGTPYATSFDNLFITRGGPYNFANPE